MLRQISLAWRNVKNNRRTIGLLSLDNWRGVKLWRNKNELSTLVYVQTSCASVLNVVKLCHSNYKGTKYELLLCPKKLHYNYAKVQLVH